MAKKRLAKKPMGRPRVRFPLSKQVAFKCRPKQFDRYIDASGVAEMDLSEWIRDVLDREAERLLAEEE